MLNLSIIAVYIYKLSNILLYSNNNNTHNNNNKYLQTRASSSYVKIIIKDRNISSGVNIFGIILPFVISY